MTIKEVFAKAGEDGKLSLEEFLAIAESAKFEDIAEGRYYAKNKHADEIGAKDKEISTLMETIKQRETDLATLQEQLQAAGADTEKLASLTEEFGKLQGKYERDAKKYQEQLQQQKYEFAVREYANATKFTSNAAKRDFIQSMLAKQLQMEGDRIIGADDFTITYSEDNADAFLVEDDGYSGYDNNDTPDVLNIPVEPKPQFIGSTPGDGQSKRPSLTELMKAKNENPDLVINFD